MGWWRVVRRSVPMVALVFGGLAVLLVLRLPERAVFGLRRPWTPFVTQCVCRGALRIMGLRRVVTGVADRKVAAQIANHASWLDIFVLNAGARVTFVSKSEVAGWPGIGWLARATGTLFIARQRSQAGRHTGDVGARIAQGETLAIFAEGTSTDGRRVLAFKPTLFAPLCAAGRPVQPVTLDYRAPDGADARIYGWWGDMGFGPHLIATLALPRQGAVHVTYHPPLATDAGQDRKALARAAEAAVRSALLSDES